MRGISHSNGTGELGTDATGTLGFRRGVHVYCYSRGYGRDRYTLTQQRTAVVARVVLLVLCIFVLLISKKSILVHHRSLSALQSSNGFPMFDGRLQDKTNEGMNR